MVSEEPQHLRLYRLQQLKIAEGTWRQPGRDRKMGVLDKIKKILLTFHDWYIPKRLISAANLTFLHSSQTKCKNVFDNITRWLGTVYNLLTRERYLLKIIQIKISDKCNYRDSADDEPYFCRLQLRTQILELLD